MPAFMGTLQHGRSKQIDDILATGQGQQQHAQPSPMLLPTPELENTLETGAESGVPVKGKKLDTDHVVVLENVLAGFKRPSFMDIKLGKRLWADDALPAKRAKLDGVASTTTSGSLGLRIAGMQIWKPADSESEAGYRSYDKLYGRNLTKDNVKDAFLTLLALDDSTTEYLEDIIRDIDSSIEEIETVVENSESRMYSASLLLVFEGDAEARQEIVNAAIARAQQGEEEESKGFKGSEHAEIDNEEEEEEDEEDDDDEKKLFDVKVIDFAHAQWVPGQGPDENFLFGIKNVRKILQGLVKSGL